MGKFREVRKKAGVTQVEIAEAVNATQGAVGHWERGLRKPTFDNCIALINFFKQHGINVNIQDLFEC